MLIQCCTATIVWWLLSQADWQEAVYPGDRWERAEPAEAAMDSPLLERSRDYALTGGGAGLITRHGRIVLSWGDLHARYDLKSTTKSIGVTALGLAIADGKIKLSDRARDLCPQLGTPPAENGDTGWLDGITILHLATQTAGFEKPGGYERLLFRPGTKWHYSDGGPNWLADCVTLQYGRDIEGLMFERVLGPIGVTRDDLRWRRNAYREPDLGGVVRREIGSGVSANVDAMARIGYLYLREGRWGDEQLIPADFVAQASTTVRQVVGLPEQTDDYGNASDHYGLLWWNNADGTIEDLPRDAYWSWGLYDSLIVVIPSLDVVAARAGQSWEREPDATHYAVLEPFLESIALSVRTDTASQSPEDVGEAPYPPSPVIRRIVWSSAESIRRAAPGSDNWPLTWGDDDRLYTAYGDGRGFEPFVERKLSLGLARITGGPDDFAGANIRSSTAEATGEGAHGRKASGMLMIDGVLYLLVRNAENSQLGWSQDRGATWTWSDWKLDVSFGCPTFLNYGRDYAGARDAYVYIYSHDSESAYEPADRMVLARAPRDRLPERGAWEFLAGVDEPDHPQWTSDVSRRGGVFLHAGSCYRSGVTYNPAIRRYLWCQVLPHSRDERGPRFEGGFGIYDAPEPWGPWTTAYFTRHWDVGPGETCSLPTKWMSDDGRTVHLVFSGDDHFSVRRGTLELR